MSSPAPAPDPRLPLLSAEAAAEAGEAAGVPGLLAELNVFRALLHHPDLARRFSDLLLTLLAGTRGSAETPGFWPDLLVYKELRVLGALGVDADAYRAALDLLAAGRYPFAELPRRCAPLEEAEDLVLTMAGEAPAPPPVHGVLVP